MSFFGFFKKKAKHHEQSLKENNSEFYTLYQLVFTSVNIINDDRKQNGLPVTGTYHLAYFVFLTLLLRKINFISKSEKVKLFDLYATSANLLIGKSPAPLMKHFEKYFHQLDKQSPETMAMGYAIFVEQELCDSPIKNNVGYLNKCSKSFAASVKDVLGMFRDNF